MVADRVAAVVSAPQGPPALRASNDHGDILDCSSMIISIQCIAFHTHLAYIGPGAGFAFLGSFFILLIALLLVLVSILSWPLRFGWRCIRRKSRGPAQARRVIVLGLDGLDPRPTQRLMKAGRLPHLRSLADSGCFSPLQSTCPPISPVAWSSFMTGSNPGKHNIFDFLNRNLKTCLPELSSTRIVSSKNGRRGRSRYEMLRKSKPFWNVLGEHGVFSTILRVPITFPPEKFDGLSLSAMCVPDLRGTQGTFTLFTSSTNGADTTTAGDAGEGGLRIAVEPKGGIVTTSLPGPDLESNGKKHMLEIPLTIVLNAENRSISVRAGRERFQIREGSFTPWITLQFKSGRRGRVHGLCRFKLISVSPEFRLYVTPIQINPERPAFPIAYPQFFSVYLAKLLGRFATLGLAEDTWALNEDVISESDFLDQAYDIHHERETMFLESIKRTRRGCCVCVFDGPDRIQHMFYRYLEPGHPANSGRSNDLSGAYDDMYVRMDTLVGRVQSLLGKNDILFVISDHGFTSFQRGINLNAWLRDNGYLTVKDNDQDSGFLGNVDWENTRAYTFGLSGVYLNIRGREAHGIVDPGATAELRVELATQLKKLRDQERSCIAIHDVHDSASTYHGPYANNGPDLIIGYSEGYRASWDAAVGKTIGPVFSDNTKRWSGDHCVDFSLVPGVFFSNRKFNVESGARLIDIGPTVMDILGVPVPGYMDGHPLKIEASERIEK